jgi:tripartite-type tricarboxylate transporter receptor subunit TctC
MTVRRRRKPKPKSQSWAAAIRSSRARTILRATTTPLARLPLHRLLRLAQTAMYRWYDMPTVSETLPGYEVATWYGVFAPAATPKFIIDRLHATLAMIFATPDAQARLSALGADAQTNSPQQFAQAVKREKAKWAKLVKESGARAD